MRGGLMSEGKYTEYFEGQKFNDSTNFRTSDDLDEFKDAGYVLKCNEVVVDIDKLSKEQIRAILEEFNIHTQIVWTERGAHLYFKKPHRFSDVDGICALGFEVEIKNRKANSKTIPSICVKRNGIPREVENADVRQEMPYIFRTGSSKHQLFKQNCLGLSDSDGRNTAIFRHTGNLKRCGKFSEDEIKKILRFINKNIFDEPLDFQELSSASRKSNSSRFEDNVDERLLLARRIMKEKNIVRYGADYWYLVGNHYEPTDLRNEFKQMICEDYCPYERPVYYNEVLTQIEDRSPFIYGDNFGVQFKNGVLKDGEFYYTNFNYNNTEEIADFSHIPEFIPHYIDIDYNENAKPVQVVDDYLDNLTENDRTMRLFIEEILGHCLITDKEFKGSFRKAFFFHGDGGEGKGTLLKVIKGILGDQNVTTMGIDQMKDERYLVTMMGRLANLGDDLQSSVVDLEAGKLIKNISSCDYIQTRKLYEQSRDVQLSASLIFTTNHDIKSFEKTGALGERLNFIPMFNSVKKKDPWLLKKLTTDEARAYWLRLAVEGYKRLYKNGNFTTSQKITDYTIQQKYNNDSTLMYVEDLGTDDLDGRVARIAYEEYEAFCEENDLEVQSKKVFKQTLRSVLGLEDGFTRIHGKKYRAYRYKEGNVYKEKPKIVN